MSFFSHSLMSDSYIPSLSWQYLAVIFLNIFNLKPKKITLLPYNASIPDELLIVNTLYLTFLYIYSIELLRIVCTGF